MKTDTLSLTRRFEILRECKNVMGKYVSSLLLNREGNVFDMFWSKRDDISLGAGNGYYLGADVAGYYQAVASATGLKSKLLQKVFPDKLANLTDEELYGVGPFKAMPLSSPVIKVADDFETARGAWMVQGALTDVGPDGPVTRWTWGMYFADFVLEDGVYKIWHLVYLEDINHIAGQDWTKPDVPYPDLPEFAELKNVVIPEPTVKETVRELYSPDRPFTPWPQLPVEYETFNKAASYGYKREEG